MYTHVTHVPKPMSIFPSSPSHSPSLSLGKKNQTLLGCGKPSLRGLDWDRVRTVPSAKALQIRDVEESTDRLLGRPAANSAIWVGPIGVEHFPVVVVVVVVLREDPAVAAKR